jgi:hypothetical protein
MENYLMHNMLRIVCVAAAVVTACSHAHAVEKYVQMPIDFVGDWCSSNEREKNTDWYRLPSWMGDERCTNILSINKYSFYLAGGSRNCDPVAMRLGKDVAPSGTAYLATITARCYPDGPVSAGKLKTFEFYRYKGNLSITAK